MLQKSGESARLLALPGQVESAFQYEANFLPAAIPERTHAELLAKIQKYVTEALGHSQTEKSVMRHLADEYSASDLNAVLADFSREAALSRYADAVQSVEADPESFKKQLEYLKQTRAKPLGESRNLALQVLDQKLVPDTHVGLYLHLTRSMIARVAAIGEGDLVQISALGDEHLARIGRRSHSVRLAYTLRDFSQAEIDALVDAVSRPRLARFYFVLGRALEKAFREQTGR